MRRLQLAVSSLLLLLISCQSHTGESKSSVPSTNPVPVTRDLYPIYEFQPQYDYLDHGKHIKATFSCKRSIVAVGEPIDFEIRIDNLEDSVRLYNIEFCRYMPLPALLAVFDDHKRYLGDMLGNDPRLPRIKWLSIRDSDFFGLGAGDYIGVHIVQVPQVPPQSPHDPVNGTKLLGPGNYTVQLIFYKAFAQVDPRNEAASPFEESFRSNSLQIEITGTDTAPSISTPPRS
jgi:hypothetical protein